MPYLKLIEFKGDYFVDCELMQFNDANNRRESIITGNPDIAIF